ncbi:MAG TPA: winged helix-turn-helix domain-containing protein [Thermoanaerobaculia bacterium]|nr:winged helix-turn-helix domain-containing protein [Thermoanaerobaculia bacterium]
MRQFVDHRFDPRTGELWRNGRPVDLQQQPAKLLDVLTASPGELVERERLRRVLWDEGTHVDYERCINFTVRQLRRALGDDAQAPRFVETLPRRGYRFVARVEEVSRVEEVVGEVIGEITEEVIEEVIEEVSDRAATGAGEETPRAQAAGSLRSAPARWAVALAATLLAGLTLGHAFAGTLADLALADLVHRTLKIDAEDCWIRR